MDFKYIDEEFLEIVNPILNIEEFNKLKDITHHGITRYDHSLRVSYLSYKVCKLLRLNYKEVTEAALLHDFFIDEVEGENAYKRLIKHPEYAIKNASKYIDLTDRQVDIIKTHMFPITFTPPKYIESIIVDLVDDFSAVSEKYYTSMPQINASITIMLMMCIYLF